MQASCQVLECCVWGRFCLPARVASCQGCGATSQGLTAFAFLSFAHCLHAGGASGPRQALPGPGGQQRAARPVRAVQTAPPPACAGTYRSAPAAPGAATPTASHALVLPLPLCTCSWLGENEHLAKAAEDPSQLDPDAIIAGEGRRCCCCFFALAAGRSWPACHAAHLACPLPPAPARLCTGRLAALLTAPPLPPLPPTPLPPPALPPPQPPTR